MKELKAAQQQLLVAELRQAFLSAYPDKCIGLGSEGLDSVIYAGLERAPRYGLSTVGECAGFIDLMINLSADFDTQPSHAWAKAILDMPKLRGEAKIARIQRRLGAQEQPGDGTP